MAYSRYDGGTSNIELRVASLAGTGVPESRLVFDNHDVSSVYQLAWSPDGVLIAVQLTRTDNTGQMGLVSVRNGSLRVLKSSAWLGAHQLFFSPAKHVGFDLPAGNTRNDQRDVFILAVDGSRESPAAVGSIDVSADGRRVIYGAGGPPTIEVWALESLLPKAAASK